MGRSPCCDDKDLKKGPWSEEEDQKLTNFIRTHGHGSWRALPRLAGLNRCGKSCRLRWTNYLRPDIKRGRFTEEEENLIINSHKCLGNKWSAIAQRLPGRTDNEIKNYWNTHLRKKLLNMGIDPVTHQPRTDVNVLRSLNQLLMNPNTGGLWDNALRLQVDVAQLARMQLLQSLVQSLSNNVNAPPPINFGAMNPPMGLGPLTQNQQAYDDVLQRIGGLVNNTVPDFGVSSQPSNDLQTVVNAANIDFDVNDINITNEVGASPGIVNGKEHVDAINDDFRGANPSIYSQFETWDTLNFDVQYNDQYYIMDQYSQPDTCLGGDTISYDLET